MAISPLAPAQFPQMPPVAGVKLATAAAGIRKSGRTATKLTAEIAAKAAGCKPSHVFLASTGVIGEPLDATRFEAVMDRLVASAAPDAWQEAATAIMTTDTFPKGAAAIARIGAVPVTICGFAKGAGMIAPDMATMLSFVFTDAPISASALQAIVSGAVIDTFNAVTIDGDTSTSDTLLAFATGAATTAPKITSAGDPQLKAFREAFKMVLANLSEQIARDGEG